MFYNCRNKHKIEEAKAQSLLEYVAVVGIIVIIMFSMTAYVQRAIQGLVRTVADEIGNQHGAEQQVDATSGYLISSYTTSTALFEKQTRERIGLVNYIFPGDYVAQYSNTTLNLGWTNRL